MKRKLALIILLMFFLYTRKSSAQVQFGVMAGPQFATQNYNTDLSTNTGFNTTAHGGATAFIRMGKELYLHETLGYWGKGVIIQDIQFYDNVGNSLGTGDAHLIFHNIELRSPLVYKTSLSAKRALSVGAGPYFGYVLSGSQKITGENIYTINGEKRSKIDLEDAGYKRFDLGITAEFNLHFNNKWIVGISGDLGIVKAFEVPYSSGRNRSFCISIGYLFSGKQNLEKASAK